MRIIAVYANAVPAQLRLKNITVSLSFLTKSFKIYGEMLKTAMERIIITKRKFLHEQVFFKFYFFFII